MSHAVQQRVDAAETLVSRAGELALLYFNALEDLRVETKGLQDRVSAADREVENLLRDGLNALFPDDGFLGEEGGASESLDDCTYLWVIDPIDGTDNFVHGIPVWCISVALVVENRIELGLILDPNAKELFKARHGAGASCNGSPIRTSKVLSVTDGITGFGYSLRVDATSSLTVLERLCGASGVFQRNGSAALSLAYVASGRYIGFCEAHLNSWDVLAGLLLVTEAGGWSNAFLENDGLRRGNPVLAAAAGVESELREICGSILTQVRPA